MTNKDWYYHDGEEFKYKLTEKATEKAKESYKEFYKTMKKQHRHLALIK